MSEAILFIGSILVVTEWIFRDIETLAPLFKLVFAKSAHFFAHAPSRLDVRLTDKR